MKVGLTQGRKVRGKNKDMLKKREKKVEKQKKKKNKDLFYHSQAFQP